MSLALFVTLPSISGGMRWMRSVWMWFMPGSRFGPQSPTSPAPASSMSSAPTSGWRPSPSRMSTPPWCSSSSTKCVTSWRPTLARSARRTSRTTLCSSTSCWMVGDDGLFVMFVVMAKSVFLMSHYVGCGRLHLLFFVGAQKSGFMMTLHKTQSGLVPSITTCPGFISYSSYLSLTLICLCLFIQRFWTLATPKTQRPVLWRPSSPSRALRDRSAGQVLSLNLEIKFWLINSNFLMTYCHEGCNLQFMLWQS